MSVLEVAEDRYFRITWGAAGAGVAAISVVVLWLANVDSKASDAINRLDRQKDAIHEMRNDIGEIDRRTIRIEAVLNEIKGSIKR